MASFSSSSSSAMVVRREEFNAFHRIDRVLFSRLVFDLKRDINQSLEVFGFLFLLEQIGYVSNLIAYLVSSSNAVINEVANEIVVCLNFLYNKEYSTMFFIETNNNDGHSFLTRIFPMTRGRLTLLFIHQNREDIFHRLRNNVRDICLQVFGDICARAERYNKEKLMALERENVIKEMKNMSLSGQQEPPSRLIIRKERVPPLVVEAINKSEMEAREREEKETMLARDDRTIFLTFSMGHPTSKEEVRSYFTRRFGEVMEAIEMQQVNDNEQPLYAKMVLKMRHASKMEDILCGKYRNKFTVNGKDVWARKYARKNPI